MADQINPALFMLAQRQVWQDAGGPPMEKVAVVPPGGGAPPMDPMAAGGAPPMDPAMAGGAPMPPGDPMAAGGAPPMDPMAAGGMPPGGDPMAAAGGAGAPPGGKMKPEQYMQMLDVRLYNMQQQVTALLNAMDVKLDPSVLIPPPGSPMGIPAEAAIQGGPNDPGASMAPQGDGGQSAIGSIDPIQGASPELAMGGGGVEKQGDNKVESFSELLEKVSEGKANTRSTDGDVDAEGPRHSSAPQKLQGAHPGTRPATQAITAGGSQDPQSRPETDADMGPVNKAASFGANLGRNADGNVSTTDVFSRNTPGQNAAAVAAMLRRRVTA